MFRFHADAIGAAGWITAPYNEVIPTQASAALPELGGVARVHAGRFDHRGILRFEEARTELIGRQEGESFETLIMVTVDGLNINDMVTADRIVARLVSRRTPSDLEASITPIGSHFRNLCIAGYPVKIDLATDVFHELSTYSSLATAYKDNTDESQERLGRVGWAGEGEKPTERMQEYLGPSFVDQLQTPRPGRPEIYSTTLVRGIEGIPKYSAGQAGHVIEIEGFGVIRLAEFHIAKEWKRLTMVRVDLGCPIKARMMSAGAQGNGSDW